jgi:formylglycine-generating enzyme required for sulfatase activity
MRILLIAILLPALAHAAEATYPHWDGSESIAEYAKRVGLEPTKTLDLGGGVKLELVLIPAGKFVMGTEEPEPVDIKDFRRRRLTGQVAMAVGGGALLLLMGVVLVRAIRKRRRPQYSLAWFLAMTVVAGIGLLGWLHWYFSSVAFVNAQRECMLALARFKSSEADEKPAHEVTLTKPYYVGKYEITQEQYQSIMGNNPSCFKGRDLPVEMVSWEDAQAFCRKVSEKTGSVVRLPTNAEWERACRAGSKTTYYTGDAETDLDRAGWYDKNSKGATHPVGQKTPNAWGVCDMHGNVWEWCADMFNEYKIDASEDPLVTKGMCYIIRGGAWNSYLGGCRSANRTKNGPKKGSWNIGFRVVVPLAEDQSVPDQRPPPEQPPPPARDGG